MKRNQWPIYLLALFALSACVTINVYFPAAQAEQVADQITTRVLGGDQAPAPALPDQQPQSNYVEPGERSFAAMLLDWIVPSAHAAQKFTANTPEARKLEASMSARIGQLKPYFKSGAIGFTNNALVGIRDNNAIPLKERSRVRNAVDAENRDRNALYREIANANGHPEWEKDIRAQFSKSWVKAAPKGWWYQTAGGSWKQK